MKTYYIYHITGIKIGCTSDLQKRMADQGFTSWNILEEHTDIYLASDREIELQKEYGLPVDKSPYWLSVQNRVPSKEVCTRGGKTQGDINAANGHMARIKTKESLVNGGKVAGRLKRSLTFEDAECIRAKFKTLDYLPTKIAKVILLASEYSVSNGVIQGIIYNHRYLTP